jgi:hypothetical protein
MPRLLVCGSLRYHLYKLLHGRALREGKTVVLTREQLRGAFPGGQAQHPGLPVSYDAESYLLTGDDDLTPLP